MQNDWRYRLAMAALGWALLGVAACAFAEWQGSYAAGVWAFLAPPAAVAFLRWSL